MRHALRPLIAYASTAAFVFVVATTALGAEPATRPGPHRQDAPAATAGTLKGSVVLALRPSAGAVTTVRAVDAQNGTTAAAARVGPTGTYRLTVPPGIYLVIVVKTTRGGGATTGFGRLTIVRSGGTSVVPQVSPGSAASKRTTSGTTGGTSPGLNGQELAVAASRLPAVAVRRLSATGPDAVLGRGVSAMLLTDLWGSSCYVLVEWEQRALILAEIRLQQSRRFDPTTRVTPRLIQPDFFVEGSLATGATSSWNVRVREIATGRVIGSDRGSAADVIRAAPGISKRLRTQLERELCLPARFSGTFSGSSKEPNPQPTSDLQLTWNGTIEFVRSSQLDAPGSVYYSVAKVDYTVTVLGKVGTCTGTDRASASLRNENPALSGLTLARRVTPGKGRAYSIRTQHQRPQPASMKVECGTTSFMYPWGVTAFIQSGPQPLFTEEMTLRGTYTSGSVSSSWNLQGAR